MVFLLMQGYEPQFSEYDTEAILATVFVTVLLSVLIYVTVHSPPPPIPIIFIGVPAEQLADILTIGMSEAA